MPIGATIGAAVIAGGATVASGAMAGHAQNKAANTAAATELQVADKNNAFAQSMYDQNEGHLTPFIDFGTAAGGDLMELLLGKKAPATTGTGGTTGGTTGTPAKTGYTGPSFDQIVAMKGDHVPGDMGNAINGWISYYQSHPGENPGITPAQVGMLAGDHVQGDEAGVNAVLQAHQAYAASHPTTGATGTPAAGTPAARPRLADYQGDQAGFRNALAAYRAAGPATAVATPTTGSGTPAAGGTGNAAQSAWNTFKNSTQYQERLNTGLNATASKYAAAGAFESGAEKKSLNDYAQTFASNEIANYMDQLYRQEALGAQAASSLAGVGTNLVSQVSANNNNAASAAANAALVHGQNSANNWNNIGAGIGQIAGAVGGAAGSSYGGGGYDYNALQQSGIYDGTGWDF